MQEKQCTQVGNMRLRARTLPDRQPETPRETLTVEWKQQSRRRPGEKLMQNLAVASALVLCAVTLRAGVIPELGGVTDAVLTAATDDSLLDEQLGRLSFVSALFPEATLVFGENGGGSLAQPVSGGMVVHAWSAAEPYMAWRTSSREVSAAVDGEVIGVYHGNGSERLVQVLGSDGLACLYGNLADVAVQTGDAVQAGQPLGTLQEGADCVFEVRRNGVSVDPALYLGQL